MHVHDLLRLVFDHAPVLLLRHGVDRQRSEIAFVGEHFWDRAEGLLRLGVVLSQNLGNWLGKLRAP